VVYAISSDNMMMRVLGKVDDISKPERPVDKRRTKKKQT
jgi:hypothetical protein